MIHFENTVTTILFIEALNEIFEEKNFFFYYFSLDFLVLIF